MLRDGVLLLWWCGMQRGERDDTAQGICRIFHQQEIASLKQFGQLHLLWPLRISHESAPQQVARSRCKHGLDVGVHAPSAFPTHPQSRIGDCGVCDSGAMEVYDALVMNKSRNVGLGEGDALRPFFLCLFEYGSWIVNELNLLHQRPQTHQLCIEIATDGCILSVLVLQPLHSNSVFAHNPYATNKPLHIV